MALRMAHADFPLMGMDIQIQFGEEFKRRWIYVLITTRTWDEPIGLR